uniref:radical SAM protein n=1 Tax=Photorhabdus sp. RM322S TaxID=3342825 RepID=UPI0036DD0A07
MSCFPTGYWEQYPNTATVITTYTCNAACKECCFECNPSVKARLSLDEIKQFITHSKANFPGLKLVVFSGGECFLLGKDLIEAIRFASDHGLLTRCVTNGYWGKNREKAQKIAQDLTDAGITEINISTGKDHSEWIPIDSVVAAAEALAGQNITTLITVEQDTADSAIATQITQNPIIKRLKEQNKVNLQRNTWMPFYDTSEERKDVPNRDEQLTKGCDQVFENIVLTPHGEISACCGLTLEHIPEMKLGRLQGGDLSQLFKGQEEDFMKVWLRTEGPYKILKKYRPHDSNINLEKIVHPCQACAHLHKDEGIRQNLLDNYHREIIPVMKKFNAKERLDLICYSAEKNAINLTEE